jgi:cytochrome c oxidase accessory protein FixG
MAVDKSVVPAVDSGGLYLPHRKIYPREVNGLFQRLRAGCVWLLLGLYYSVPWLEWDGRQAVLFDLPARKFHIFGLIFWPQDFFYLAWLLIMAGLTLFFTTALAGRVWCGYACPQTVWTEVFIWMERWTEGGRAQRQKLDRAPWGAAKLLRKSAKQILWVAFALWTGFTFVGYFTPAQELLRKIGGWSLGPWETFWILFYSFATYGNAGFLREQVCKYMCPYARFQSAMFDKDTLIISYDPERGEPRGGRKHGPRPVDKGDCVDCSLCVQVCPTGIDIRDGLQSDCIACGACIDACDDVMEKMGYPKQLIRYTTEHSLHHKMTRVLRTRTVLYGSALLLLFAGFVYSISQRVSLRVELMRDRNALYRLVYENHIENIYTLKILNMDARDHVYRIRLDGVPGAQPAGLPAELRVPAGEVLHAPLEVKAPLPELAAGIYDLSVTLESVDAPGLRASTRTRFITHAR